MPIDRHVFRKAGELIDRADEVVILSHHRPDGDAIGSTVGVRAALVARGKRVSAFLLDPIPQRYQGLTADEPIDVWDPAAHADVVDRAGAVLVLDTGAWSQLQAVREVLGRVGDRTVVVDHHQTQDDVGALGLIDPTAGATGLIVYEWFRALGWNLPPSAMRGLFAAVATDTGWFRFSNTDARVLRMAADLVQAGVEAHLIYEDIYWSESIARIALMTHALDSLEIRSDGRLAIMRLDQACFRDCNAEMSDSENIINEPMRIGSVIVSALLVEQPSGEVRASLRSKGQVDVASLASSLGGGGHQRAAGVLLPGPLPHARQEILRILEDAIARIPRA